MPKQKIEAIYPLSPIQQGILFHCLYAPDSGVYFEHTSCELRGDLDIRAFQRAWEMLIARHATLRTAFVWDGLEKPLQAVGGRVQFRIDQIDWRDFSRDDQQKQIEVFLEDDRRRGFDLHRAPLMRVTLICLSDAAYYFVWSHHHIVMDGWSSSVLMKDLFSFYQALVRGEDSQPERSRSYCDYIEWLNKQNLDAAEQYWRKQLQGFKAATSLPVNVNGSGPGMPDSFGEAQMSLSEAVTGKLKALAKERRMTLNTLVEGSWALLLSRYSRERDVVFGLTVSGRPAELSGVEQMVGLFINTLPLRVTVREEQDVWSWLTELQQQQSEMQMFEYSPLVDVQGWSDVERGTALFESILVFENYPVDAVLQTHLAEHTNGLRISNLRSIAQTNYALTLIIEPRKSLRIRISYERDRFTAETIERVLGQYARVLESVARGEGEHGLQGLSMLSEAEREQVLHEWPRARTRYEDESCLQELFEREVERRPGAVAVVYEGRTLSYGELNSRANQLAHYLRAQGVRVEEVVGLYVERSLELVVGVLGILKAGCAYLPLEASQPSERVQFMLSDAQVRVVVTQAKLAGELPTAAVKTVSLDGDWQTLSEQRESNPVAQGSGQNVAYLIYTSGSTGQPKGVMVSHYNVVRLFAASAAHYEFGAEDVWTLFHSYAFDFSVWELWGALLHGGRLVVVPYWVSRTPAAFWELLRVEQVTVLNQTPSAFRQLQAVSARPEELSLRYVIFGGEALEWADVSWWFGRAEGDEVELVNMYGITETTVHVSYLRVPAGSNGTGVGIGKGLADLEVYLLDEQQQPVGQGVGGELYVGGGGLARGYWQRPELTAQRFIPHPYSADGGARLYRTGDLGRYLADGTIEYLGRVDEQVKVRGFRVELGEIEAVLREQVGVRECAVLALEKEAGEKQLAAYVVGVEGRAVAAGELRQYLREKLPDYMIPAVFVSVSELPLTANGKLDRKALLALSVAAAGDAEGYEGPRTAVEEMLSGIYGEVLELGVVSRNESFFDLGGHSLLATQAISRVRELFQVELALRSLFERPTVAGLAEAVTEALGAGAGTAAVAGIERADRDVSLPLSYAQQRLWFLEQLEPGQSTYNVPLGVRLSGRLEVEALRQTLAEVVRRHEVLRTRFATVGGEPVQVIAEAVELGLAVEELSELGETEQAAAVAAASRAEAEREFDLEHGPLLRVRLLRLGAEEHVLLLTLHHIISDGWSMSVLVREVAALYEAYREGQESPLPELAIQYVDFAVWQRQWLESGVLEEQMSYWRQQLGGELPVLRIANERVRSLGGSQQRTGERLQLSAELSQQLKSLSRREGVTLFMLLLAAWQTLLSRYSGQEEIIVGAPVANRTRLETEGLVGFFVNQLVLRTDLSGDPSFRELLARVRAVCIGAYAHQDVPFEKLVEELQPHRSLSRPPLYQVMMSLQKPLLEEITLSNLTVSPMPSTVVSTKLDLSLSLIDGTDQIVGLLEYNGNLFDTAMVQRIAANFSALLENIVAAVSEPLSTLGCITRAEQLQLSIHGDGPSLPSQGLRFLPALFEQQVTSTPKKIAIICHEQQLTYEELNHRANQLAHYLVSRGINGAVGVCMDRSSELVVALLAVFKAGCVYVPLEPTLPATRLRYMIANARLDVVLAQSFQLGVLADCGAPVWLLEEHSTAITAQRKENLPQLASGTALAYLIYTSGTTGQPKAVMVEHGNLANTIVTSQAKFQFNERDVMPVLASFSFDISLCELLLPLVSGGTAKLISKEEGMDVERLIDELQGVTVLHAVPSLMRQLVTRIKQRGDAKRFGSIRQVLVGGDAVQPDLLELMEEVFSESRIEVLYGPTEGTIICASHRVKRGVKVHAQMIGKPLGNVRLKLKGKRAEDVPLGARGEIWIGGPGVSRGYQGQEELTKEKYVRSRGARYYRTGDLGRYLADGTIEYLGRVDEQVKVRGFRVELGEIEAVLREQVGVRECAVLALEKEAGEKQLAAYVVGVEGRAVAAGELRQYLREKLPDYMVPAVFVSVSELPLTANGKLDRKALLALSVAAAGDAEGYEGPRTAVEEMLSGIYGEVLELGVVSRNESFFDLGGHSLLATQVISRVRELFQVELALRSLFERPTVAGLAEAVTEALGAGAGTAAVAGIERADRSTSLPLSYAQQRLWFLEQLEPGQSTYNVPLGVRLSGRLEVEALRQTLAEVVRRHEVLRTRFGVSEGKPQQIVESEARVQLEVHELPAAGARAQETLVEQLAAAEAEAAFDLEHGPLLRARLLRLGAEEHVLLVTMHHIISDGWSMSVLVGEVAALYEAYRQGDESPLPELAIQYADFAVWQREWLGSGVEEQQLGYWRRQLGGELATLELATEQTRGLVASNRGERRLFAVEDELWRGLQELSRGEGVTLFMLLLAAWQTLLYRYTGETDVVVGTDVANRNRLETEGLIGFFVNQLVLRTDLSGEPSFRELLQRVREVCLGAYAHQDVPFERLVEELQPERSLSQTPLYQVMFVLQNAPQGVLQLPGLRLSPVTAPVTTAKFDLVLTLVESESGGLGGTVEYRQELFTEASMLRLTEHYRQLLASVVAQPAAPVSRLNLLSASEREQILVVARGTQPSYGVERGLVQRFEEQVAQQPEALAVRYGERQLSYRELNERANQVGHYLVRLGVGREVLVGLCLRRSVELVVGMLGILKAGGAYLPLDPSYPAERLQFMLEDGQVAVLLSEQEEEERLPAHWGQTISLDGDWELLAESSPENVGVVSEAEQLAYVIYTSGSSGVPKGVSVTQGAIQRLVCNSDYLQVSAGEVVAQASNASFDAATFEIWGALLNGGVVNGVSKEVMLNPEALAAQIAAEGINILFLTTALFNQVAEQAAAGFKGMKAILFGGQAVDPGSVRRIQEQSGPGRLLHVYGPTECTTYATWQLVREVADGARTVPIGKVLANTEGYILDGELELAPPGVVGELYLGGPGLARGYWQRPELSGEKFVPHPHSVAGGERLYATGDLVRYRSGWEIEFLGRVDEQVKVRGFRVELGEIEAVLREQVGVRECAVLALEKEAGEKQLAAYVVGVEGRAVAAGELRQYLREKLPDYMVPAVFVSVSELPLTANGKLDRKALLALNVAAAGDAEGYEGPRTAVEEMLSGIYGEVLELGVVSRNESFFDLGGHSLLATQVISRVRELFQVELALRSLFERPTVAGLAEAVTEALGAGAGTATVAGIERADRDVSLPLSYAQQRLWFLDQLEPGSNSYNVQVGVRLSGRLAVEALRQTLAEVVRRHEVLRTRFAAVGGEPVQVIAEAVELGLMVEELSELGAEEQTAAVAAAVRAEAERGFDLQHGPLLRVRLLRLEAEEHVLLLTMHHIICDAWSINLLVREVATLYEAYATDESSTLPELSLQYADFAVWQRAWLSGDELEKQLVYWRQQLHGPLPVLEFPTDWPRPLVKTTQGAGEQIELSLTLTNELKEMSRREGVTLFMILLAAWQMLLSRYTGQKDIIVGTAVANRNRTELEQLAGFFVNTLVLRTDLSGAPSFKELLRRVREVCLGAYAHQDIPFEKLVEELQPNRDLSRSPLFQSMFSLQNAPHSRLELPGLTLHTLDVENRVAKFDLTFTLTELVDGIHGELTYSTQLFKKETIERVLGQYARVLESVARGEGEHGLQGLSMLSEAEREQVLHEWPRARTRYEDESCLQELFEREVERRPGAVAVVYEGRTLSYGELNSRANQLAHYLRAQGVRVEEVVGLYVERSLELVVGVLGILKAGCAYLPLEASQPSERVQFMLSDAQVRVVVTQAKLAGELPTAAVKTVSLDGDWQTLSEQRESNPVAQGSGQNVAYLIYTSGSTGQPKGVMVSHYNVVRLFAASAAHYEFGAEDVWTLFHSYAFDFSVWELWGALLHGGRLVVVPYWVSRTPAAFWELLRVEQVTVLNQTPSAFRQLQAVSARPEELSLRYVIFGGEALEWADVSWWFGRAEGDEVELVNMYGITETTVHVSYLRVPAGSNGTGVGIGKGLADLEVYLLDEQQQPVGQGVGGELYVGGGGLARGYWQRPELTAQRFIPHPYSADRGARLYRTGDLGRYLANGSIEFLGRADQQVKIRGYRIEPGEIKASLIQHPAVADAAVVVREDNPGEKRLVAYIVPARGYASATPERHLHTLPNGLSVFYLNKNELEHLYRELYEDQLYLSHGISLREGDCVFDVGANIGIFTLFAHQARENLKVYAFEPNPVAFDKLRLNVERYGLQTHLFQCGLSDQEKMAQFTFYPQASVMSGFYPDLSEEKQLFKTFMLNQPSKNGEDQRAELGEFADELTERFESESFTCELKTVSQIISEHQIDRIDLLKIDVEKSEVDVLKGIAEDDWNKIRQIVIEVHDIEQRVDSTLDLLRYHGFDVQQSELVEGTGVYNYFATRPSFETVASNGRVDVSRPLPVINSFSLNPGELQLYLRQRLPEYMIPTAFCLLDELPITSNGKLDTKALPVPDMVSSQPDAAAPRSPIEKILLDTWTELLGIGHLGINDNFFDLGGHSLLATRVISRVRELFQVELALRSLFERPTVAGLAEAVAEALGAGAGAALGGIERADRSANLPLSYAQQRLWFLEQLEPGGNTYNVPVGVRLSGVLELEALRQTLQEVVRRHEVLRTRFVEAGGQPVQVIEEPVELALAVEELSELGVAEQEAAVAALGRAESERGFDLEHGPLLRVRLLRLGAGEHVLLLTMHHIISDGWSMSVLVREVAALYEAYRRREKSPLPELSIQYADFAMWQREWLESGVLAEQMSYWRQQLGGELPVLQIASERVRELGGSLERTGEYLKLSVELSQQLKSLSQREGVTLFMLLLAAWQILLHRYSGDTDVIVGTDVANRTRLETEGLIGFFVNQLVLRMDLSGDPSFRELLARVRAVCIGAYAHQDVPFEKLVEELQPDRSLSRSPLFQVKFVLQNMPSETLELSDLKLSTIAREGGNAKLDLSFLIIDGPDGINGALEYSKELFNAETISTMLGHFETLLKSIAANPEARLKRLNLLTEAEKEQRALSETQQEELALKKLTVARRRAVKVSA